MSIRVNAQPVGYETFNHGNTYNSDTGYDNRHIRQKSQRGGALRIAGAIAGIIIAKHIVSSMMRHAMAKPVVLHGRHNNQYTKGRR